MLDKLVRTWGGVGILTWLGACAHSPQQMRLEIQLAVEPRNLGMERVVLVTAADRRSNKVVGSRGGVYAQTSLITIRNPVEVELVRTVTGGFSKWGFVSANNSGAVSPLKVHVVLEELSYASSGGFYTKPAILNAIVSVTIDRGNYQYSSRYKSSSERRFLTTPSNRDNQDLINELLQETLSRLFQDAKLIDFLS